MSAPLEVFYRVERGRTVSVACMRDGEPVPVPIECVRGKSTAYPRLYSRHFELPVALDRKPG